MIKRAEQADEEKILEYIGKYYIECLYLYINLKKYGAHHPNVALWLDEEHDKVNGVYLKYFDCLHFFTRERNFQIDNLLLLIRQQKPQVIFMPMRIGETIKEHLTPSYGSKCMEIMSTDKLQYMDFAEVRRANRADIPKVVDFLMTDTEYTTVYNRESVYSQFLQRYDDGFSRFHYILRKGQIIACEGTNAELDNIAIMGGLLTDPSYRRQGLGSKVLLSIWNEVLAEGKQGFSFVENPVSKRLHNRLGIHSVAEIAKFYKYY